MIHTASSICKNIFHLLNKYLLSASIENKYDIDAVKKLIYYKKHYTSWYYSGWKHEYKIWIQP